MGIIKYSLLFGLALQVSSCGKKDKKSEPKETIVHFVEDSGICFSTTAESLAANNLDDSPFTEGACPETIIFSATGETLVQYNTCNDILIEGVNISIVLYEKLYDEESDTIFDLRSQDKTQMCDNLKEAFKDSDGYDTGLDDAINGMFETMNF